MRKLQQQEIKMSAFEAIDKQRKTLQLPKEFSSACSCSLSFHHLS